LEDCLAVGPLQDVSAGSSAGQVPNGRQYSSARVLRRLPLRWPGWNAAARDPVVISVVVTAIGAIVWMTVFPRVGTDLSAQLARAGWAGRYPGSAYIFSWYGGIYPASYSLLAPYLLAAIGTRLAMAVAAVISAGLLALLLKRHQVARPRAAALWAAIAMWTQLSAGRGTFTLGLAAAFGCIVVADSELPLSWVRSLWIACLAALTCLLSPVVGLFLGVAAATFLLTGRRNLGLLVGLAAGLPLAIMAFLSAGGVQPIGRQNALPTLLAVVGVLFFVPRRWRMVHTGAIIYGVGVIIVWALPTPVGSNVERLGELLIGPLLIGLTNGRHRALLALGLIAAAVWVVVQPVTDLGHGNAPPYWPETAALVRELRALDANTARVEAVPQYGHWESEQLAGTVLLARGWERQVDTVRNRLFYSGTLTPAAYHGWLRYNAVRYVAISASTPDFTAVAESAIVLAGQPWLVPVWHDALWRLYRVVGSPPLASEPGTVTRTTPAEVDLRMSRAGASLVRVRWSPLLRVTHGATLARDGDWTSLTASRPGAYVISAPY
jgi:hypothetical protein